MKPTLKNIILAQAVLALCATPFVFAENGDNGSSDSITKSYSEEVTVNLNNEVSVYIDRQDMIYKDITIEGGVEVDGLVEADAVTKALVDNKQLSNDNEVANIHHDNDSAVGSIMEDASGNLGLNVTTGDNNIQDNAAAIAAADAEFVFDGALAIADVVVNQDATYNDTLNMGSTNSSSLGNNALSGASGNIGVNISAGNSNLQKNNLSAAVAPGVDAEATVSVMQQATGNLTLNHADHEVQMQVVDISLSGSLEGGGSLSGSYNGAQYVDQMGDVYPDIWPVDSDGGFLHMTDQPATGHLDLDTDTQGGVDLNGDGGALAFTGAEGGVIDGELTDVEMAGTFTGQVVFFEEVWIRTSNTAMVGDGALNGASGNIGVNVASGTNNVQNNSLSMVTSSGGSSGGGLE